FLEQAPEGAVRHGELLHSFEGFMIYSAKLQPPYGQNGAIMPISDVKSATPPENSTCGARLHSRLRTLSLFNNNISVLISP
ncbi:MAG: hypothetical protein J1E29_05395, partial [Duncaniella sp.]|nr:hypothetical protein [Duncaniella sp.]